MPYSSSRWRSLVIALGKIHHILYTIANIDETQAVVLQAKCRKCRKLFHGSLVVCCFVCEAGEDYLGSFRHGRIVRGFALLERESYKRMTIEWRSTKNEHQVLVVRHSCFVI